MLQWILGTMFNSKKTVVAIALASISIPSMAQTIGDIAAFQRAKALAQIKGEPVSGTSVQAPADIAQKPINQSPQAPKPKSIQVIATYEVDGGSKALITNHGNTTSISPGEKVNQYVVKRITTETVSFQSQCRKNKKSTCKVFDVNVGGGL